MTLPNEAQVVVVGAGIVGTCAALYLARGGREALLLDRTRPWGDASGVNAGTLSLQVKAPGVWQLAQLALELWARLDVEVDSDLGFTSSGGLRVATDETERGHLVQSVLAQRAAGLTVDLLSDAEKRERAPWLGPDVVAASYCATDAYASPLLAGPALMNAAQSSGAMVFGDVGVTGLETCATGYRVHTTHGEVTCRDLVLTAGAGTGELAAHLGLSIPVFADLNMLHITESAPPCMHGIVTHIGGVLSLKQYPNGTCLIGGGWQGIGNLGDARHTIDHENLHHNLATAVRVVPALAGLRLVRSWTGFEALAPDALPVLGAVAGHPNLYIAACARGGYTLAPAQAWLLCEQIAGRAPTLDITGFAPARFGK